MPKLIKLAPGDPGGPPGPGPGDPGGPPGPGPGGPGPGGPGPGGPWPGGPGDPGGPDWPCGPIHEDHDWAISTGLGHWERRQIVTNHPGGYSSELVQRDGVWGWDTTWSEAAPSTTAVVCVWVSDVPAIHSD